MQILSGIKNSTTVVTFISEKTIKKSHSIIISDIRVLVTSDGGGKGRMEEFHWGGGWSRGM